MLYESLGAYSPPNEGIHRRRASGPKTSTNIDPRCVAGATLLASNPVAGLVGFGAIGACRVGAEDLGSLEKNDSSSKRATGGSSGWPSMSA